MDDINKDLFGSDSEDSGNEAQRSNVRRRIELSDEEDSGRENAPREEDDSSRRRSRSRSDSPPARHITEDDKGPAEASGSADVVDDVPDDMFPEDNEPERHYLPITRKQTKTEVPVVKLDCVIPDIPRFSNGDEEVVLARLPAWMGVDNRPFDEDTWDEEDEIAPDPSIAADINLENTVRWRNVRDANGDERKESNARLVRWSDGTTSLILGGEVFDATYTQGAPHQYIAVSMPDADVLKMQKLTTRSMMFKPQSRTSMVHQKLKRHLAATKAQGQHTKMIVTLEDPEREREALEKVELEKIRAKKRLEAKRRNAVSGSRRMNDRDLEGDSDDDMQYAKGNAMINYQLEHYESDFVEDDEDEEEDDRRERERAERVQRAKRPDNSRRSEPRPSSRHDRTSRPTSPAASRIAPRSDPMDIVEPQSEEVSTKKKRRVVISSDED
ncbi:hypothetical protein HKX48_001199 [Thoreauomyces humboldtii]|nr:hypothetical protein HKX48_001199 [Thoreauomyces humboldtii]